MICGVYANIVILGQMENSRLLVAIHLNIAYHSMKIQNIY